MEQGCINKVNRTQRHEVAVAETLLMDGSDKDCVAAPDGFYACDEGPGLEESGVGPSKQPDDDVFDISDYLLEEAREAQLESGVMAEGQTSRGKK